MNFDNLKKMIDEGYISMQQHPSMPISIYNYTQRTQFDRVWNDETLQCRGLIMDQYYQIVARPFPKFFNLAEHIQNGGQLPAEDFVVTEKMDGSLGILYWNQNLPQLATRGSFTSDQAKKGSDMLMKLDLKDMGFSVFSRQYTYLFEIIYPENRIVVDYGGYEGLVLLAVIETETGREQSYETMLDYKPYMRIVEKHDAIRDFSKIDSKPNSEGYVITFPQSRQRFKIKFDEYIRLHRLVTGVNARRIWDLLKNDQPLDELLEHVPDEFYKWVKKTADNLINEYEKISKRANVCYLKAESRTENRKDFALYVLKNHKDISQLLFAYKDDKDISQMIWKMLKPKAELPFKENIDL